jgi:hypothetical protein
MVNGLAQTRKDAKELTLRTLRTAQNPPRQWGETCGRFSCAQVTPPSRAGF